MRSAPSEPGGQQRKHSGTGSVGTDGFRTEPTWRSAEETRPTGSIGTDRFPTEPTRQSAEETQLYGNRANMVADRGNHTGRIRKARIQTTELSIHKLGRGKCFRNDSAVTTP